MKLGNAKTPEMIPTYEGSNQATHPSVLYFQEEWQGYHYWMAMTPYPFNNNGYEDPSMIASHDGKNWVVPKGLINPIVPRPEVGHNCDVELVYDPDLDELRLYYVEADDVKQSWVKLLRSKDGVHWSMPEVVLHDENTMYGILSPSIIRFDRNHWKMWYVDTGNTGWENQSNVVRTRTSADGIHWSTKGNVEDLIQTGYQIWHFSIWRDTENDTLHAIYPAYENGTNCDNCILFYAYKKAGEEWKTSNHPIMVQGEEGAWDDFCLYRTSVAIEPTENVMKIWYGAKKRKDNSWNIGLVECPFTKFGNLVTGTNVKKTQFT